MNKVLDLNARELKLQFFHPYVVKIHVTLENLICAIMQIKNYSFVSPWNKNDYGCCIVSKYDHRLFMEKETGRCNILYLKDNEPFTITGIDGKFKFEFSALKPYPYCGDIVKSNNFLEILENSTLTNHQAYIIEAEEEKRPTFFDGRPGRIKIQDYRY